MNKNVVFVGGIHGVGKTTICREICSQLNFEYLSASDVLKWSIINEDPLNKFVQDIQAMQDRLIEGLKNFVIYDKIYLLDGHFCLLSKSNKIECVSLQTFIEMNPIAINILLGDVGEIKSRLETRDYRIYDLDLLNRLQQIELEHAHAVSKTLGVTLNVAYQNDYDEVLNSLRQITASL